MQSDDPGTRTGGAGEHAEESSGPLRRVASAVGSLLTNTVVERATRFLTFAVVARSLGAESLGQLSLAIALMQLIGRLIVVGIPALATREVARDPLMTRFFAIRGSAIALAASVIGYAGLAAFLAVASYESSTVAVIVALFAGMIPFAWAQISEAILIGRHRASVIAFVGVPVNLIQTGVALVLLASGSSVAAVAATLAGGYAAIALFQGIAVLRDSRGQSSVIPDRHLIRESGPFFGIQATNLVRTSSTTIIISLVVGEVGVGIFSAASQLQMPLRVVSTVLATALYPTLATMYRRGRDLFSIASSRATELTVAIILPGVVGLLAIGDDLLDLIFDSAEFDESAPVLSLLAVAAFCASIASILGRVLMAADRESTTFRIAVVNTSVGIVVGVALTVAYGVIGAAVAGLVVALLNVVQHAIPAKRIAPSLSILSTMWAPLLASGVMAIAILAIGATPVLLRVVVAGAVYVVALGVVWLVAAGGRAGLRAHWAFDTR